jgi:hypothetical protein
MAKYCKICGEPMSLHDELDDPVAREPRRQAVANRTRRDARLARVTASLAGFFEWLAPRLLARVTSVRHLKTSF